MEGGRGRFFVVFLGEMIVLARGMIIFVGFFK